MPAFLRTYIKVLSFLAIYCLLPAVSQASHIFGIDLYYNNVGGNVYTVTLAVYGDCSGSAFFNLSTSSPNIDIYNGNTFLSTLSLAVQPPSNGFEVSPVCTSQLGNTTCTNIASALPGIKRFIYAGTVTLPGTSTVWRFLFNGNMGGTSSAGRSNSITNLNIPGAGSTIQLIDTLNNVGGANSSAFSNTIPTPFFCINSPANYNPAAVDPNGDNLTYYLVPAIDAATGVGANYVWPYNATMPVGAAAGTFSFSNTTGQLSFTPNVAQRADVVYNVREMSGGVLKGTSQREMTIVVLSPCSNSSPTGSMSGATGGTLVSGTQLNICNSAGAFSFSINPTDADGDTISMTTTGLPMGATFTVVNNNTPTPLGTFQWNASTATPGTYTFYVNYQDKGCPLSSRQSIAYTITILPSPSEVFGLISPATCTRRAVFTVTPSTSSPFTVSVLQGSVTLHSFSGVTAAVTDSLFPGTYTIRTLNSVACYKDTLITIISPPLPSANIVIAAPLCTGNLNGSVTATATSGAAPFTYALGAGSYSTSGSFTGLAAGVYVIHIKDANGCVKDTAIAVPNATPILENIFVRRPTCNGHADGRVIINAYNSIAPYTFAVGSGPFGTSDTFSNLAAGTYTFHIMNGNGCIDDTTLSFIDSQYLHASISIGSILCNGGSGVITMSGIGGFGAPYSYASNTGPFGPFGNFTLPAGTYTFHVNDPQSCFFDTTVSIAQPTAVVIATTVTNIICFGAATGSVAITATGGTPPYTYAADAGAYGSSAILSSLAAGSHTVNVKDANGCVYSSSITISQPTAINADSATLQLPLCQGGSNGSIRIYASGGSPVYTYAINAGAYTASSIFNGLTPATYILHIKDANGCVKDTTITLPDPPGMTPAATVTPSLCQNLSNGQVTLSATGGTPAYMYAVGTGTYSSSPTFTSLAAATYTFHIRDANGCMKDTIVVVANTTHIMGLFTITSPLCNGDANGIITVTGSTGLSPYTYALGSAAYGTANVFNALAAGAYTFHIADANGCIGDTTVSVIQPATVYPSISITAPLCFGNANGSVVAGATGGTAPYTYALNNGSLAVATTFAGLAAGIDTITVSDAHGCLHDTTFSITEPTAVAIAAIAITNVSCNGGADGMAVITATGGTPVYAYAANTGVFLGSNVLTGLTSGTQMIHVRDSHGCTVDSAIVLTQPIALSISGTAVTNPTCQGYADGAIAISVAGGTAPYSYSKDNVSFSTNANFAALTEGAYTIYVTDNNSCTADTTITLVGYPHILIDSFHVAPTTCNGTADGAVVVFGSGGNHPLSYMVNGTIPTTAPNLFIGLSAAEYPVVITDSTHCHKDSSVTIPQPDSVKVTTNITPNDCIGSDDQGAIIASVTGGTAPYRYLWSLDSATASYISKLANGTYGVYVTDANNCQDSITVSLGYDNCCTPFLPNAFSPNGDGRNEVFRLGYKGDIELIEFSVYNRYGERVFLTRQTGQGWDGTYKGQPCDIGAYYYYVKFYCGNRHDKVLEFKGDVTLVK